MKVLMYGWEFPPHISGGLGTACYGLTKGLIHNDTEVLFVVPKAFGDENATDFKLISASGMPVHMHYATFNKFQERLTIYGVNSVIVPYLNVEEFQRYSEEKIHSTATRHDSFTTGSYEFTGRYGKDLMDEVWKYAIVSAEIARNNTFDIIHAHDWLSFPAGMMAKEITGKPFVAHVHATEFDRSGEHVNQAVYEIERSGMHAADSVITVSDYTRKIVMERYDVPDYKITTIYNGVEPAKEKPQENAPEHFKEKIISYLGRVTFQKGPDYFIEAANKVLQKDKNFRFVMAGSGDMLNRMIKRVAELRISSHFHFTGFLKGDKIDKLFAMSDVYVMPSVSEPFGISPLEALRSDVPVIISKQSGVREVLNHALKVDFWDTDAMANAIFALSKYNGLSSMFVREGKQELEKLQWDTQAAKMKNVYQQLVNNQQ